MRSVFDGGEGVMSGGKSDRSRDKPDEALERLLMGVEGDFGP